LITAITGPVASFVKTVPLNVIVCAMSQFFVDTSVIPCWATVSVPPAIVPENVDPSFVENVIVEPFSLKEPAKLLSVSDDPAGDVKRVFVVDVNDPAAVNVVDPLTTSTFTGVVAAVNGRLDPLAVFAVYVPATDASALTIVSLPQALSAAATARTITRFRIVAPR